MWKIKVDYFKVLNMLLGQKSGFTKYPCFICEWDSRDRINHWIKCDWSLRECITPGYRNILQPALVDRSNVILPPLHIKLGLIKQYLNALNKEGASFKSFKRSCLIRVQRRLKRVYLLDLKSENLPKMCNFYLPGQM